jgi:hypothetical protein
MKVHGVNSDDNSLNINAVKHPDLVQQDIFKARRLLGYYAVRTDVSEELGASFIRVTRIGELGTTLAVTSNRNTKNIPEDAILYGHRRENLKSYKTSLLE